MHGWAGRPAFLVSLICNLIAIFYAMEIVLTMLLRSRLGFGVSGMQIAADAGTNAGDH